MLVKSYVFELDMTSIFPRLVHMFVYWLAKAQCRARDFPAMLKTHWWLSDVLNTLVGMLFLKHIPCFYFSFQILKKKRKLPQIVAPCYKLKFLSALRETTFVFE